MYRWALVAFVLLAVGCGKSFQEADAIYKDEVAKLESLKAAMNNEMLAIKAQDSLERMKSEDDEEKRLRGEWLIKPKTDAEANSPPDFSYQARNTMASQRKSREMALTSALKKIEERYGSLFEEQERRIDECYQAKESAK